MQYSPVGKRQDVYIALMGLTGAGKSTFISHFTEEKVVIGHGIESCTKETTSHPFRYNSTTTVHLIDSPGFDDTDAADHHTLEELAAFLKLSYENNVKLSGIIYLHRITDVRMSGSSMRSLSIFRKLVGPDAYSKVILATNRWEEVQIEIGEGRERGLTSNSKFWGLMRTRGCQVKRVLNTKDSAMDLIRCLVADKPAPVVLDIQRELVDNRKQLIDTAVGREAAGQHAEELKARQSECDALKKELKGLLKARERAIALEVNKERARIARLVQDLEKSFQNLRLDMERQLEERAKRQAANIQRLFQVEVQTSPGNDPISTAERYAPNKRSGPGSLKGSRIFEQYESSCGDDVTPPELPLWDAQWLLQEAKGILMSQPMLLRLPAPTMIIGGIYGRYVDLARLFNSIGKPGPIRYLMLGNYTNCSGQEPNSLDTFWMCLAFKVKHPDNFYLLRGPSETIRAESLRAQCRERYDEQLLEEIMDLFAHFPVAATIGNSVFCANGGWSRGLNKLEQIDRISRPLQLKEGTIAWDLVNGGATIRSRYHSIRIDKEQEIGPEVLGFCADLQIKAVVRSQRFVAGGYEKIEKSQYKRVTLWNVPALRGWGLASVAMEVQQDSKVKLYVSYFGIRYEPVNK